jgi:hypothetical protein
MIEQKVERILEVGEPISDGAPLIYTNRADGVKKEFDIRSDRFDVAVEAMDKVSKSYTARRADKAEMKVVKDDTDTKDSKAKGGTKGTGSSGDSGSVSEGGA